MATRIYQLGWQMGNEYYTQKRRADRAYDQLVNQEEDVDFTTHEDVTKLLKDMDETAHTLWAVIGRMKNELIERGIEIPPDVVKKLAELGGEQAP